MLNKISINKLFLRKILKFIFLVRYLLLIFLISIFTFLIIPKFMDFKKDFNTINNYLKMSYNLDVKSYDKINYKIFPRPKLVISNSKIHIGSSRVAELVKGNLDLKIRVADIYQIKNLNIRKVYLYNYDINLQLDDIKKLLRSISSIKNKINIFHSTLKLKDKDKIILVLKNVNASNVNLKNIKFSAKLLEKKLLVNFIKQKNNNKLNLTIKKLGIETEAIFLKESNLDNLIGEAKVQILNNKFRFNFNFKDVLKITKSNFRNKNLVTSFNGVVEINPFLNFDIIFNIKKINKNMGEININRFLNKEYLKKINGKFLVLYENNSQLNSGLIKKSQINLSIKNGNFFVDESKILFSGGLLNFYGDTFNFQGMKKINFNLLFNFRDTDKFLKYLSLNKKKIKMPNIIETMGSFNILPKKINLNKIRIDSNQLNKQSLQRIKFFFDETFGNELNLGIFDKKNIKKFINSIN